VGRWWTGDGPVVGRWWGRWHRAVPRIRPVSAPFSATFRYTDQRVNPAAFTPSARPHMPLVARLHARRSALTLRPSSRRTPLGCVTPALGSSGAVWLGDRAGRASVEPARCAGGLRTPEPPSSDAGALNGPSSHASTVPASLACSTAPRAAPRVRPRSPARLCIHLDSSWFCQKSTNNEEARVNRLQTREDWDQSVPGMPPRA
jgi:hypothetical protein